MLAYLMIGAAITFSGALFAYLGLQYLNNSQRLEPHQARSYFVMVLAFLVVSASVIDYLVAGPRSLLISMEQRVVPVMLVNAGIALLWLLWGGAKIGQDESPE